MFNVCIKDYPRLRLKKTEIDTMPVDQICYSEKYFDDKYEYR
ncbi:hypothetical protein LSH36_616g00014 [Paralvinella palmiformis]|uniref:Uncharacterized protein n=1 Tax=Paralvinella palmiformis TaxID=53620 RepID=A0AAD9J4L8_9ANNE|nr:hypothetical protein LSH36_616g00014 [Paralvinella palmiformis]